MRKNTYPMECTSCHRIIRTSRQGRRPGMLYYGGHGMCHACYAQWKRCGRPEPASDFRHAARAKTYAFKYEFDAAKLRPRFRSRMLEVAMDAARQRVEAQGGTVHAIQAFNHGLTIVVVGTATYLKEEVS